MCVTKISLRCFAPVLFILLISACGTNPNGGPLASAGSGDTAADAGMRAASRGDYKKAAELLEMAAQKGTRRHAPDEVLTALGNAYNELDRFEEAIATLKKALQVNPNRFEAWNNLGVCYRLTNQLDEAEKCYQRALSIEPSYAEAHASLGALHIFREQPEKAIVTLEKALELDPQIAVGHANLALAYATVGRFNEADARLKQAIILGYKNGPKLKERIAALRQLSD